MSKYRPLTYGHPVPQSFFDAMQEYISTLASANFALSLPSGSMNQVQVFAGSGNAQVGIGIEGLWRYNAAPVVTQVTGAAGTYDLFVTCGDNAFPTNLSPPPPETDQTNYAFSITAVATGQTPTGVAHSRRVGQAITDGTRILVLRQIVGQVDGQQLLQPGMIQTTAAATVPPGWLLCNGLAVPRTTYAALYAALGGPSSPWGQGDLSSTFNLPDLRGKVQVGAGTGALAGAYNLPRSLADVGGTERVTLTDPQMPSHSHGGGTGFYDVNHLHGGTTNDIDRPLAHTHSVYDNSTPFSGGAGGDVAWSHDANGLSTVWGWGGGIQRMWGNAYLQYLGTGPNTGGNLDHLHTFTTAAADRSVNHQHAIPSDGGDQYHENMPPFAVVNVVIKF